MTEMELDKIKKEVLSILDSNQSIVSEIRSNQARVSNLYNQIKDIAVDKAKEEGFRVGDVVKVVNRDLYDEINGMLCLVVSVFDKALNVLYKDPDGAAHVMHIGKEVVKTTGKHYESLSEIVPCFDPKDKDKDKEKEKEEEEEEYGIAVFNVGDEVTYTEDLCETMYGVVVEVYTTGVKLLTVDTEYGYAILQYKDAGLVTRTGTRFEELTTIIDRLKLSGFMKTTEV